MTHDPSSWSVWYFALISILPRDPSTLMKSVFETLLPMKAGLCPLPSLKEAEGIVLTSSGTWYQESSVSVASTVVLSGSVWVRNPVAIIIPAP